MCRSPLPRAGRGRPPAYCSRACQAKAYRRRKNPPVPTPAASRRPGRRRQIAEALWRIAAERGLDAASMREIAAEARVSLRVVQYHFDGKHELLLAALAMLNADNERRARARMATVDVDDPRELLRAILDEFLPVDEQRLLALRVFAAYFARSLVDPELAAVFLHDGQPLEELVATVLTDFGGIPDPRREADLLVSGITGLGMDVVHGRRTLAEVRATIAYHLDRLGGTGKVPGAEAPGTAVV
ncbi:hypothetical protein Pen01_19950 [Phytomonospora endophytica]|nr:hypothetical protein Pen01_19950 [Phytomonospora endophytica]